MSEKERKERIQKWYYDREKRWYGDGDGSEGRGERRRKGRGRGEGEFGGLGGEGEMVEGAMSGDWEEVERWEREARRIEEEAETSRRRGNA